MNKAFIRKLYQEAKKIEKKTGIPAVFIVAQAILEQGWDIEPIQDSNNIYGIKYHIPQWGYVKVPTMEYIDGHKQNVKRMFQKYPTLADCIEDHTRLLLSGIKGKYADFSYMECLKHYKSLHDYKRYVECVAKSYATDPGYARKILNITEVLNEMGLTKDNKKSNIEFEVAKEFMKKNGIMKPYGEEGVYWATHVTREELAVILARIVKKLKIAVKGDEK